ncbi:hypothetical protein Godav_020053 [Gossypium davidsonii]|uniref:Aminotransferase-like plant mobile domain-containing protein n=1 Tax=Gossypium davidsonii TaxID=34287 RepID=A0A7J8R1S5_GOSDV|nr:hypothetical protein [Gossypium davidsonii]
MVGGSVVIGSVQSADWGTLRNNFSELAEDSTKERRERYVRVYILQVIGGILMPNKSLNLVHLRWLLKLVNFKGAGELSWGSTMLATLYREMCQAMKSEKFKISGCLLLLHSWFEWKPNEYLAIRAIILEKFFVNPNVWHVKVSLELDGLHRINLQRPNMNWSTLHSIHGKPYLLGEEVRCRHPHKSRPRQPPLNPRGGKANPSSTPVQESALMASAAMPSPHSLQFVPFYSGPLMSGWAIGHPSSMWYTPKSSHFPMIVTSTMMYRSSMHEAPTESAIIIPSAYRTPHSYNHSLLVT